MFPRLAFILVSAAFALTGCGALSSPSDSTEQDVGTTTYVDINNFNDSAYQGAWSDLATFGGTMATAFGNVCGDTFCEGDYSNLTPLTLMCAVSSKEGIVHDCAWTFAGSLDAINDKTATISVDAPTFECHFHPKSTTVANWIAFLQGADPIHTALPGTTGSINDELVGCFQDPIGHTPITFTNDPNPTYVDADVYYTSAASQAKWAAAKAALVAGFNNVCGDTFCGSDYGDLSSLAIACSVTKSTGNVKSCDWIFGGSITEFNPSGIATPHSKSWTCPVAVKGTLPALINTLTSLTPPGGQDPIDRPLPGETTSAYDDIGTNCLP